jgi:hypothetical protein
MRRTSTNAETNKTRALPVLTGAAEQRLLVSETEKFP